MATQKKSLITTLKTAKKANIASAKPEIGGEAVSVKSLKLMRSMRSMKKTSTKSMKGRRG